MCYYFKNDNDNDNDIDNDDDNDTDNDKKGIEQRRRYCETRRLAACAQAVVILRSTSYIAIELNVLHFRSNEIQSNRRSQAILPLIAFLLSFVIVTFSS